MTEDSNSIGKHFVARVFPGAVTLTVVMAVVATVLAVVYSGRGATHVFAIVAAAVAAYLGALIALCLAAIAGKGPNAINMLLAGTLFRFGIPMAVGVVSQISGGPLADAGVFGWIVLFFLIGLVVETPFAVRLVQHAPPSTGGA